MLHPISHVRILARAYLDATGISARVLSLKITQSSGVGVSQYSEKLIGRMLDGKSCRAESLELASDWFRENWPERVPWPLTANAAE